MESCFFRGHSNACNKAVKPINLNNRNFLTISHQNVRSLRHKIDELTILLADNRNYDIVTYTEHWLREPETKMIQLLNYTMIDSYSRNNSIGGGTIIFVRNCHSAIARPEFKRTCAEKQFECSVIELSKYGSYLCSSNIIIVTVYRSPLGDVIEFLDKLASMLEVIALENKQIIITGDFNIDFVKDSKELQELNAIIQSHNIKAAITVPTRVTSTTASVIDNILTTFDENYISSQVNDNGISDHTEQVVTVDINNIIRKGNKTPNHESTVGFRPIDDKKISQFRDLLLIENWESIDSESDVNTNFDSFMDIYIKLYNEAFPLVIKKGISKTVTKKGWITDDIRAESRTLKQLYSDARDYNNQDIFQYYKCMKRAYQKKIVDAKFQYNKRIINSVANKPKKIWEIVKRETGRMQPKLVDNFKLIVNNNVLDNPVLISNAFNEFYLNVAKDINSSLVVTENQKVAVLDKINNNAFSIVLKPATKAEIFDIVRKLKNTPATGIDGIKVEVVKKSIKPILELLTALVNQSLNEGIFPNYLKKAIVIPMYKNKGEKTDIGNHRPLSLLTIFSKVYENVIKRRLVQFINEHKILKDNQFGFRNKLSTEDAIDDSVSYILKSMDNKKCTLGLYCDLQKAFDCLDHELLARKMEKMGIRDIANNLIVSYLQNRHQLVEINSSIDGVNKIIQSNTGIITSGIPQGSVLGPLLFILYMNDLSDNISNVKLTKFADDTTFIAEGSNMKEAEMNLNNAIADANAWFATNKLVLNNDKTKLIVFKNVHATRLQAEEPEIINGIENINSVDFTSFLGLQIDTNLNWHEHLKGLYSRLTKASYALRILRDQFGIGLIKTIFLGYFESVMKYGIIFWGGSQHSNKIFRLQKLTLRMLHKKWRRYHCKILFKSFGILTLPSLYIYEILIRTRKYSNKQVKICDIHNYDTRNKNNFLIMKHKTSLFERDVLYIGTKLFNRLPQCIKSIIGEEIFKSTIKLFLIKKGIYSMDEFNSVCDNHVCGF